jgi:ADP-ribose pyrophosphatase YjhB (NUDIX family)
MSREELKNKEGLTEKEFLANYDPGNYPRPSVTVDTMILGMNGDYSGLKILLIQRGNHPYIGCWALPGGFVSKDETAHQAAARELKEETGLDGVYLDQIYTFSRPGRDPRGWVMSIAYLALIQNLREVSGADDAADAAWFDLRITDEKIEIFNREKDVFIAYDLRKETFRNGPMRYENFIPKLTSQDALAFDHVEILIEAFKKLRKEIRYNDQAFCMVEEHFTLPELQAVYEAVLGQELYKKSFRDMIKNRVTETGQMKQSRTKNGRKCKEYRKNQEVQG